MRYLFLLNPTAGKRDCTAELAPAIQFREPVCPTGRLRLKGERYVRHQIPAQR